MLKIYKILEMFKKYKIKNAKKNIELECTLSRAWKWKYF